MMNLLALGLLLSSLAAAGVWSPHPETKPHHHDPELLYEAHRLIVVEYERQVPRDPSYHPAAHHRLIDEAKDKIQEAASLLPNVGRGISAPASSHNGDELPDKASQDGAMNAVGKIKDQISDKASQLKDGAMDAVGKGKDVISDKASQVKEGAMDAAEKAKDKITDKASQLGEGAKDAIDKGKDKISEKASLLQEGAKGAVKTAADGAREAGEELAANISSAADKPVHRAEAAAADVGKNLTDIFRRARDVACDTAAYVGARETARAASAVAHLLAVSAAYGACVWVTFVSSHVLAGALPRQQLGMVQSKLYPVYFRVVASGVGVALLGQYYGRDWRAAAERVQAYNLTAALGLVLVNILYLEPKATKAMFERMKMEKEEGRGRDMAEDVVLETPVSMTTTMGSASTTKAAFGVARTAAAVVDQEAVKSRVVKLNRRLKRLNACSSVFNILTLMGLTWHLVHLAHQLQPSCC